MSGIDVAQANGNELTKIFSGRESKASSKIYQNLATDPILADLIEKKKFTYRETLIEVSTVVGALDEKIETLQKQANNWSQIRAGLNTPLIKINSSTEAGNSLKDSNNIEEKWFLKYLTLRNILGFFVIFISMSAGFFSFLNKDYRSLIQAEGAKAKQYADELTEVTSKKNEVSLKLKELEITNINLESRLAAADEQIDKLDKDLNSTKTIVDRTEVKNATQQADLNSQLVIETNRANQLEDSYNKEILDRKKWEEIAKEKEKSLNQRSQEVMELERSHYAKKQELDSMVNAWNQLLVYIGGKAKGRLRPAIEVKVSKVNDHIEGVVDSIGQIDGMRIKVPTE